MTKKQYSTVQYYSNKISLEIKQIVKLPSNMIAQLLDICIMIMIIKWDQLTRCISKVITFLKQLYSEFICTA